MAPFPGASLNTGLRFQVQGELLFKPAPQMFLCFQSLSISALGSRFCSQWQCAHPEEINQPFIPDSQQNPAAGVGLTQSVTWK